MIKFQFFPRSRGISDEIGKVINCFKAVQHSISSAAHNHSSNIVLEYIKPYLEEIGYTVEAGKTYQEKIQVPVLFGTNNQIEKSFNAAAISSDGKIVVEVEAAKAVENNQFLKDIFQACMMFGVEYLVIAVQTNPKQGDDFHKVFSFLETLFISNRIQLPLQGILLIGY